MPAARHGLAAIDRRELGLDYEKMAETWRPTCPQTCPILLARSDRGKRRGPAALVGGAGLVVVVSERGVALALLGLAIRGYATGTADVGHQNSYVRFSDELADR